MEWAYKSYKETIKIMNSGELAIQTPYGSFTVGVRTPNGLGEVDYIYDDETNETPSSHVWEYIENELGTPEEIADSLFTEQRKQAQRLRDIIESKRQIA